MIFVDELVMSSLLLNPFWGVAPRFTKVLLCFLLNHVLFRFVESFLQTCNPTCNPPRSDVKAQVFQV